MARRINYQKQTILDFVRFEVFTAMTIKNIVFWDVAPRGSGLNRGFGGTYRLHLKGRILSDLGSLVPGHPLNPTSPTVSIII
jgi:hypothetical protein